MDEPHALSEQTFEDAGRFSPEGGTLLTLAAGQIKLIDLEGNVQQTIQEPGAYCSTPRGPPDGEWFAYSPSSGGFIAESSSAATMARNGGDTNICQRDRCRMGHSS